MYELLKLSHMSCVLISGLLFVYRYARLTLHPERTLARYLKVVPHINDTLLLAAAIGMLVLADLNPFATPWLLAKMLALVAYVGFGVVCMRSVPGSRAQTASFVVALGTYAYIVSVAFTKQVFPA